MVMIVVRKLHVTERGQGSELSLEVETNWTVKRLKKAIEEKHGISAATQLLCFQQPDGAKVEMRGSRDLRSEGVEMELCRREREPTHKAKESQNPSDA